MVWQDIVITATNLLFGFMLIPQLKNVIIDKHYLNLWSCGLTFIGLMIVNITMVTLELWLSAIPICTIMWLLLFIFSWKNIREEKEWCKKLELRKKKRVIKFLK